MKRSELKKMIKPLVKECVQEVLLKEGLGQAFLNTFAVALPATLIPLIICSYFAYALTWMKFYGRDLLLATIIASLVVPLQMCLIPVP